MKEPRKNFTVRLSTQEVEEIKKNFGSLTKMVRIVLATLKLRK